MPTAPPEVPQPVWDAIVAVVAAVVGYIARWFQKRKP